MVSVYIICVVGVCMCGRKAYIDSTTEVTRAQPSLGVNDEESNETSEMSGMKAILWRLLLGS